MKVPPLLTMFLRLFSLSLLCLTPVFADFQVAVVDTQSTSDKSLVKIKARNAFDQGVKGARAWVFLMDDQGRVVGQRAQWIIGGEPKPSHVPSKIPVPQASLNAEDEAEYTIMVAHDSQRGGAPTRTKITFSRIILEDGTLVNPQKAVKPLEENK